MEKICIRKGGKNRRAFVKCLTGRSCITIACTAIRNRVAFAKFTSEREKSSERAILRPKT